MAEVFLTGDLRELAGGAESLTIEAADVRELIVRLEQRFPGLGQQLEAAGMAVAIDGEIFPDALYETLEADSEVHFLPSVRGG